jgi:hypothetical protein
LALKAWDVRKPLRSEDPESAGDEDGGEDEGGGEQVAVLEGGLWIDV